MSLAYMLSGYWLSLKFQTAEIWHIEKSKMDAIVLKQVSLIYQGGIGLNMDFYKQLFKQIRYRNLKIQDGHNRQTCKTKPVHISLMDILVSRLLFRHLKQEILSPVKGCIDSNIKVLLVLFLPTREVVRALANYTFILHRSIVIYIPLKSISIHYLKY